MSIFCSGSESSSSSSEKSMSSICVSYSQVHCLRFLRATSPKLSKHVFSWHSSPQILSVFCLNIRLKSSYDGDLSKALGLNKKFYVTFFISSLVFNLFTGALDYASFLLINLFLVVTSHFVAHTFLIALDLSENCNTFNFLLV